VIDLAKLSLQYLDRRHAGWERGHLLAQSNALILNIDYPLGLAAYDILSESLRRFNPGVYVMGKAATLNAVLGDVMVSNGARRALRNTYLFPNCFSDDVAPIWLWHGAG
jgi:hypothetical protein